LVYGLAGSTSGAQSDNFIGSGKMSHRTLFGVAIEHGFKLCELLGIELGRVNYEMRSRLVRLAGLGVDSGYSNRSSGALPAESSRFGAIVDSAAFLLGRCCQRVIDQMDLITVISTLSIVTDKGTIREAERLTRLLSQLETFYGFGRTVAFAKLVGIGICLDAEAELFIGYQVKILEVIRVVGVGFCARGAFTDVNQAVPGYASRVSPSVSSGIKDAMVYTSLKQAFANIVPSKFRHIVVLLQ
jgi:hypothetical protein